MTFYPKNIRHFPSSYRTYDNYDNPSNEPS